MNMIKIKNLSKKFGKLTAVNNINLEVKKGEIFAFLGPNGAGKSTTIKMLTTVLSPSEGKMEVNGVSVVSPSMPGQTLTTNLPYMFDELLRLESDKKGNRVLHTASTFTQICKDRSNKLEKKEDADIAYIINKITGK